MALNLRKWLLITAVIAPIFALGQTEGINRTLILEHLYRADQEPQWQGANQTLQQDSERLSQQAATVLAGDVLEQVRLDSEISSTRRGRLLSNAGVLETYAGNLISGRSTLNQALEVLTLDRHQFDPEIATVVTAIGVNAFLQEDFETAEDHFRWSQHIQHREDGLYSANQAKNLNWLTRVYLAEQDFDGADTAQRYILRIARNTYKEGSPELTKVKDGIAKYFAQRGKMISPFSDELQRALRQSLFADAITLLDENLQSMETQFGPETLALVNTLETQAEIYYWRGNYNRQQERALERALAILRLQPSQNPERLAAAWLNLADGYVLTGNRKAIEAYASGSSLQSASQTPSLTERSLTDPVLKKDARVVSAASNPKIRSVELTPSDPSTLPPATATDTGTPSTQPSDPLLLWPEAFAPLYFEPINEEKYPEGVDYYADFSFTISEMGKPQRIRITARNVPSEEARWARSALHHSRYRPALLNGVAVPFDINFRQIFRRVSGPDPLLSSDASDAMDQATNPAALNSAIP